MTAREPVPYGIKSLREFWPFYVREHLNPVCRNLHVVGSTLTLVLLASVIWNGAWAWIWTVPVCGYAFAWIGHFVFEKNRPATFRYPVYSLACDFIMLFKTLTFQMNGEIRKALAAAPKS